MLHDMDSAVPVEQHTIHYTILSCLCVTGLTNLLFCIGTSFRPLSLDVPQPLFPVAGYPVIHHHVEAASQVSFFTVYTVAIGL